MQESRSEIQDFGFKYEISWMEKKGVINSIHYEKSDLIFRHQYQAVFSH